jgi:hypothetical protein
MRINKLLLPIGLSAVTIMALFFCRHHREPSYQGKTLTELIVAYQTAPLPKDREEAARGLRTIGTNAIPYLIKYLREEDRGWIQVRLVSVYKKLGITIRNNRAGFRARCAARAFGALGSSGKMAVPALSSLLTNYRDTDIMVRAADALTELAPEGLTPLMGIITNRAVKYRHFCLLSLSAAGTNATPIIPLLVRCMKDEDVDVANSAINVLGSLRLMPDLVVPALTEIASDQAHYSSQLALRALGEYGSRATSAIPALLGLIAQGNKSMAITNALLRIDPEVLGIYSGYGP